MNMWDQFLAAVGGMTLNENENNIMIQEAHSLVPTAKEKSVIDNKTQKELKELLTSENIENTDDEEEEELSEHTSDRDFIDDGSLSYEDSEDEYAPSEDTEEDDSDFDIEKFIDGLEDPDGEYDFDVEQFIKDNEKKRKSKLHFEPAKIETEKDEEKACPVCKENKKTHILTCGHSFCSDCCESLIGYQGNKTGSNKSKDNKKLCAICRKKIEKIIKMY